MALAYFETSLLEPDILNLPAWEDDYSEFVEELKLYFGSSDLIGESESKIKNLTMKSSQRIAKYIVEFNRLVTITGWDGRALRHQFYRSLPSRIKDELARIGKPATLPTLKALAQSIDGRYWEREEETRRERGNQPSDRKNDKPQNQASSSSNNNNNNNSNNNKNKNKKNPIRVITDRHPRTRNGRKQIWGRNLVRMENLPRLSDLVDSPIICVSSVVELDIQQRIVPKLQKLKEEPHRSRRPTANPPRTRKNR